MDIKKTIGIALCCLFGGRLIGWVYDWVYSWAYRYIDSGFNTTVDSILWVIIEIMICCGFIYAYQRRKGIFNNRVGEIATLGIICVHGLYVVNQIVYLCTSNGIFKFMGVMAFFILSIIVAVLVVAFLFSSKAWLPIKIVGSLSYVPAIILWLFDPELFELYTNTDSSGAIHICEILVAVLSLCAVILTLIWMSSKKIQQTVNK